jgi:C-terminal processing protease CtpA/Prc
VRIATFNVESDTEFLEDFIRIIGQLSQDGLILDVRGNGGGLIHAGERLLQLLTPGPIDPCRFHFLNSARTEKITKRRAFSAWNESIAQAVETGAEYSQGLSLLPVTAYNDIGQKYQGPVVLVTDALCYSTTDIFAAGFQDNRIGKVLGVDENTGAGGANVWEYSLISDLLRRRGQFPRELPGKASFRFAVRRVTRIGNAAGLPLEDLGVHPDELHEFTRDDVLKRNVDLIRHAAAVLGPIPKQRLTAAPAGSSGFRVECTNIDRVDAYIEDRPLSSTRVRSKSFALPAPPASRFDKEIRLQGFRKGKLVAATRVPLR